MVKLNIIIAGVGGQGVELASDILEEVALEEGLAVKKTDSKAMTQRAGSVVTQLRIGEEVVSPLTGEGEADILLAFEKGEAARWSSFLRDGACAIVNDLAIPSLSVSLGRETYFEDDGVIFIKGSERIAEMEDSTVLNVFMLGALSMLTPFNSEPWGKVIARRLPAKTLDNNLMAFQLGRREMLELLSVMPDEDSCADEMHDDDCGCH